MSFLTAVTVPTLNLLGQNLPEYTFVFLLDSSLRCRNHQDLYWVYTFL